MYRACFQVAVQQATRSPTSPYQQMLWFLTVIPAGMTLSMKHTPFFGPTLCKSKLPSTLTSQASSATSPWLLPRGWPWCGEAGRINVFFGCNFGNVWPIVFFQSSKDCAILPERRSSDRRNPCGFFRDGSQHGLPNSLRRCKPNKRPTALR